MSKSIFFLQSQNHVEKLYVLILFQFDLKKKIFFLFFSSFHMVYGFRSKEYKRKFKSLNGSKTKVTTENVRKLKKKKQCQIIKYKWSVKYTELVDIDICT